MMQMTVGTKRGRGRRAPVKPKKGFENESDLAAWVANRTLWIENSDGSGAHALPSAGPCVYQPAWSRWKNILYVRNNALWLIALAGGICKEWRGFLPG